MIICDFFGCYFMIFLLVLQLTVYFRDEIIYFTRESDEIGGKRKSTEILLRFWFVYFVKNKVLFMS